MSYHVYTCRRLIDLTMIAVYTCRRLIDLTMIAVYTCRRLIDLPNDCREDITLRKRLVHQPHRRDGDGRERHASGRAMWALSASWSINRAACISLWANCCIACTTIADEHMEQVRFSAVSPAVSPAILRLTPGLFLTFGRAAAVSLPFPLDWRRRGILVFHGMSINFQPKLNTFVQHLFNICSTLNWIDDHFSTKESFSSLHRDNRLTQHRPVNDCEWTCFIIKINIVQ